MRSSLCAFVFATLIAISMGQSAVVCEVNCEAETTFGVSSGWVEVCEVVNGEGCNQNLLTVCTEVAQSYCQAYSETHPGSYAVEQEVLSCSPDQQCPVAAITCLVQCESPSWSINEQICEVVPGGCNINLSTACAEFAQSYCQAYNETYPTSGYTVQPSAVLSCNPEEQCLAEYDNAHFCAINCVSETTGQPSSPPNINVCEVMPFDCYIDVCNTIGADFCQDYSEYNYPYNYIVNPASPPRQTWCQQGMAVCAPVIVVGGPIPGHCLEGQISVDINGTGPQAQCNLPSIAYDQPSQYDSAGEHKP